MGRRLNLSAKSLCPFFCPHRCVPCSRQIREFRAWEGPVIPDSDPPMCEKSLRQRQYVHALSANVSLKDVETGKEAGFDHYLGKPIRMEALISVLQLSCFEMGFPFIANVSLAPGAPGANAGTTVQAEEKTLKKITMLGTGGARTRSRLSQGKTERPKESGATTLAYDAISFTAPARQDSDLDAFVGRVASGKFNAADLEEYADPMQQPRISDVKARTSTSGAFEV